MMPSDAEDTNVDGDQDVTEGRKLKLAISREQNDDPDESGRDLQPPGETIVWMPTRPAKDDGDDEQQC